MIFPRREEATNNELVLTIIEIQGYLSRYGRLHTNWHETLNEVIARLEQEPKTGHWNSIPKYPDIAWYCSECEHFTTMKHNYCPNCGSYNGGDNNGNE